MATVSAVWQMGGTDSPAGLNDALPVCAVAAVAGAGAAATLPSRRRS